VGGFHDGLLLLSVRPVALRQLLIQHRYLPPGLVESRLERLLDFLDRSVKANRPFGSGAPRVYVFSIIKSIYTYARLSYQWIEMVAFPSLV
jgi:hypothetical protein